MSEYTDCPHCQDIVFNEERGHIVTFDQFFMASVVDQLLDRRSDIHIAIDVSETLDYWEDMCYHITWRRNLPKENKE